MGEVLLFIDSTLLLLDDAGIMYIYFSIICMLFFCAQFNDQFALNEFRMNRYGLFRALIIVIIVNYLTFYFS